MASGRINSTIRVINKEEKVLLCHHEVAYTNSCKKLKTLKVPNTAIRHATSPTFLFTISILSYLGILDKLCSAV